MRFEAQRKLIKNKNKNWLTVSVKHAKKFNFIEKEMFN